ncbi:MAG TPA: sulfatase-like hydrolase/transferase [Bacteroidales bacterium]|nr:sulfatase-like hydrolase/transferase [Bacteroidales bacterium]
MKKYLLYQTVFYLAGTSILMPNYAFGNEKTEAKKDPKLPNILVILADDQGYADVSYHEHPQGISTPAIDQLAKTGIVFTNGYASAYVSAPTRAGFLTGRYQQRYGFYTASDSRQGLPVGEILLPELLKKKGYKTGIFGKWHLGLERPYYPTSRGFDTFYGFLGHGGHDYFDLNCQPGNKQTCIYRNDKPISDTGYLTDNLAREACNFIGENAKSDAPFFLYLPFNAVHAPLEAPEADINKFNSSDKDRDIQLAMIYRMDLAIGEVIKKLKETGKYDNTLIFYFNDNGGAKVSKAINTPLRDYKHSVYEGGIRVPFLINWPGHLNPGTSDEPVISLDIFPTICAVLGIDLPSDRVYDGRNILPILQKKQKSPLHETLFWDGNDGIWAIREGKWKLIQNKAGNLELYDLNADISEKTDLSKQNPQIVDKLNIEFKEWRSKMETPMGDLIQKRNKMLNDDNQ